MFEMEKWCSNDFGGSVVAMANRVMSAKICNQSKEINEDA